eukprot:c20412_g1_i1 orf=504-2045(-)
MAVVGLVSELAMGASELPSPTISLCPLHLVRGCLYLLPMNAFSSSCNRLRMPLAYQPHSLIGIARKGSLWATHRRKLRRIIINIAGQEDGDILPGGSGLKLQTTATERKWNIDKVLAIGEGMCVVASATACVSSMIGNRTEESRPVANSSAISPLNTKLNVLSAWQVLPLVLALFINAVLRARPWQGTANVRNRSENFHLINSAEDQRINKLEEDVGGLVTNVRMLARQLEKLGVRFRVTRQTLKSPIQETALLAQKTSEAVSVLVAREDMLEKELIEIQGILLAMQESQAKQLKLISALGKVMQDKSVKRVDPLVAKCSDYSKGGITLKENGNGMRVSADRGSQNGIIDRIGCFIKKNIGFQHTQNVWKSRPDKELTHTASDHAKGRGTTSVTCNDVEDKLYEQKNEDKLSLKMSQGMQNSMKSFGPSTVTNFGRVSSEVLEQKVPVDSAGVGQFFAGRKVSSMLSVSENHKNTRIVGTELSDGKFVQHDNRSTKPCDAHPGNQNVLNNEDC